MAFRTDTLLARALGLVIAIAVAALGFFLFTTLLVLAGVVFVVGLLRLWWTGRGLPRRPAGSVDTIDVEYERVDDRVHEPDAVLPPAPTDRR